jgi:hypothetical protein
MELKTFSSFKINDSIRIVRGISSHCGKSGIIKGFEPGGGVLVSVDGNEEYFTRITCVKGINKCATRNLHIYFC